MTDGMLKLGKKFAGVQQSGAGTKLYSGKNSRTTCLPVISRRNMKHIVMRKIWLVGIAKVEECDLVDDNGTCLVNAR